MHGLSFLGEEDFLQTMENPCKEWRAAEVRDGYFESYDGARMHYYTASPASPKGCIVMVHGFCEFYGKYHELSWYFYQAGYAFFFMENRGHGYSARMNAEMDVVDIDDFSTYVRDLHTFLETIVTPQSNGLQRILFAHSMGGAISTRFLEQYPDYFSYAILNSPMLKMRSAVTAQEAEQLREEMERDHTEKNIASGQKHFSPEPDFQGSSCDSRARYDYVFAQRLKDVHYQTRACSIEWFLAALAVHDDIMRDAAKLQTPVTIFTAGRDHLIDSAGYEEFREKSGREIRFSHYENAKHELFGAEESSRKAYFEELFQLLSEISSMIP